METSLSLRRGERPRYLAIQLSMYRFASLIIDGVVRGPCGVVPHIDPSVPQPVFTITKMAPTRAFSWLKAPTSAFTFKTLLRH